MHARILGCDASETADRMGDGSTRYTEMRHANVVTTRYTGIGRMQQPLHSHVELGRADVISDGGGGGAADELARAREEFA